MNARLAGLLPPLLAALLLVFLQWRSGISSYSLTVGVMAVFAYVTLAAGQLVLAAAGERDAGPSAAWTVGLIAVCFAVYGITQIGPLGAGAAFGIAALVVIGVRLAVPAMRRASPPHWRELAGFALCIALAAAWCAGPAGAYKVLASDEILPVWQDYFIHGGVISQLGDPRALGRGSIYLADFPPSFYHFASYGGAAALAGLLDRPGLPLATSAWLPLGFLAMAAGALALGQRLAGAAGGLAALVAVAILPDASNYGLRNGLFSFHWMMLSHPGADYALGASLVSLALLDRWSAERSPAALVASLVLAAAVLLLRAQIFLLFFLPWLATAIFCSPAGTRRKRLLGISLLGGLAAAAAVLQFLISFLQASGWRIRHGALEIFLFVVHSVQEPTAYTGVYDAIASRGGLLVPVAGIALTFVAALGAFVVLLPAAVALARRFGVLRPVDAFPGYLAFWWLLLMVVAPEPWIGDGTNLLFQPFVLVYAAAAIWTLCLPLRCVAARAGRLAGRLWASMAAVALIALPALAIGAGRMAHPKFQWGQAGAAQRVEPGLAAAAAFLRAHASVGDAFASSGLSEEFQLFDLSTKLCSLTGMPAYLSRPYLEMIKDAPRKRVAAARLDALREVEKQSDYREAMRRLRRMPVQWYVSAGEAGPVWDPGRQRATFSKGAVSVYATKD